MSNQIRRQLDTVVSPKSKLTKAIRKPKATWVEPKFYADVEYRDIASEGLLRGDRQHCLHDETWRTAQAVALERRHRCVQEAID
ncbi:hypothetical protein [Bradyrhizobium paxllaeri]|uniref:hypothetical protein n=1 Tax=Bradyrhizobium paxllaeri TaxID=190148 RepID=UPI000810A0D1